MIEYVKGNILDTDCVLIAHGCNAQGVMGSGVAKAIRDKWPVAYEKYREEYELYGLKLGDVIWARIEGTEQYSSRWVLNCITQEYYGRDGNRYVNYGAIAKAFYEISCSMPQTIAIPKIGAGLGGGDWNIIAEIIEGMMGEHKIKVYEL